MDETCELLRQAWGTSNARTLPISATGSAGMEAAFVNTVHDGDVVVVGVNGLFGQRMCDVAARCGAEVVAVEHEWGTPVDVQRMLDAHPSPALYAAVHAETSTGVRSDIAALGAAKGDALLITDAVTSIAGIELLRRRLGDRRRLRRHPEVPRRRARPGAVHDQRPGLRPPRGEAPQLVPRPRPARRVRRRGGHQGRWPHLPPHRPGGDGRQPARRPDPDRRGGPGERLGPPPRGRQAAAGRPARSSASSCSPPRATGSPS